MNMGASGKVFAMTRISLTAAALAVLVSMAAVTTIPAAAQPAGPPAITVTAAQPLAKRITTWDEYTGRFEAVERVELRPRVSGYIESIHFKDGALVKKGERLFTIDKRPFEIAVESATAEIARQNAAVEFADADLKRAEPLVASKVMSEQVFEQRRASLNQALASLMAAKAALQSAQLNLEWADVTAPTSGRISDRKVDPGNLVAGGQEGSTLLATIVSQDPIHFVFEASEADYLRYTRLQLAGERPSSRDRANPVKIKLADETEFKHDGTMDFVDNAFNDRSGTMRGRAVINNKDGLLVPGIYARLALYGGEADVLLVPDASIVSDQANKIVYTVNAEDTVAPVQVELGPIYEGLRVIKSGLKADDKVIIEGIANPAVRPGAKVSPTVGEIKTAADSK